MGVTIKDVAREAGVSIATVSKVINGSYSISKETIARVNDVMKKLDYHPNTRARNLAQKSNRTIVFVTSLEKNVGFTNPHMFEMMCGLENYLSKKDYSLVLRSLTTDEAPDYIKETFDVKKADGFIIHASLLSEKLDETISKNEIPHLVLGMPNFESHMSWIDVNNKHAGEIAAKYLLACGYCSLAFIGGRPEDKISMNRLEGVLTMLKEHDVVQPQNYIKYGESATNSGFELTREIIELDHRPEAIICANNYLAYGCVSAIKESGLSIPKDIGVLTIDDFPFSKLLDPQLSVVNIDVYDLGYEAGKNILKIVRNPNVHIQSYITNPNIIQRESTVNNMR